METDPIDGLSVAKDVGDWALDKHARLRRYIDIAQAARWKYVDPQRPAKHRGGASYIDLFSGPGRARLESGEIIDGSPLVAFKSAREGKAPFSEIHLADFNPNYSTAAAKRIGALGGIVSGYTGDARDTAREITAKLNPEGLHFAFLDPYNLSNLSFEVIRAFAPLKRVDLMMHVSVLDIQRNADRYTAQSSEPFDYLRLDGERKSTAIKV